MKLADKIVGNIIGKPRKRGGRKDWDGDGVRNKKDCQPRNTMRQDRYRVVSSPQELGFSEQGYLRTPGGLKKITRLKQSGDIVEGWVDTNPYGY